MAYAALVSLAQTTVLILNHPTYSISLQEKNQILGVKEYAVLLQEFLEVFPHKANSYEGSIRELTHGAENILQHSLSEHFQQSLYASLKSSNSASSHLQTGQYQYRRYKSYNQLIKVTKEIELIAEKLTEIKNSITNKDERVADSTRVAGSPSRVAPVHKEAMVGLENNLMEVKLQVCRDSSKLEILPIVGMGGIGKTTLVTNVYNDPLIMERFDIHAWVTVSQDYNIQEIVSSLLVSIGVVLDPKIQEHNNMEYKVHQHLKGRKYLIVIDDIWSINAWDELKLMFPDDGNGSRIMLTTRLSDVATYAGCFHEMRLMDNVESWNLLQHKVFKQDLCPDELKYLGFMIASSCRGLPLAVVVISGLLAVDQSEAAWENIAKDVKSAISTNDEQIDQILSLSYTHLPHHLRACFLYMGGFPEEYRMRASRLIKLWVAEGFLKPDQSKSFEETAEEYLEDLVKRSLFLVTERKSNGGIKFVGIHDLMREMCIRKAKEENFFLHVGSFFKRARGFRIAILAVSNDWGYFTEKVPWGYISEKDPSLPVQVYELFHLRYLSFDGPCKDLSSISNLQSLQTIIIGQKSNYSIWYGQIFHLPVEIWRMPQLRHILFYYGFLPLEGAAEHPLENLQTLSGVVSYVCTRKTLKMIPNLKKLGLICYADTGDDAQGVRDYEVQNIKYLQQLETLKIVNDGCDRPMLFPAFPKTLKKLSLQYLKLSWEDMSAVASLPHLEVLKLRWGACIGDTWETSEGGFPELNYLLIDTSGLQQWITESSHFPRLKCLVLRHCWRLRDSKEYWRNINT